MHFLLIGHKDLSGEKYSDLVSARTADFKEKTHVLAAGYKFLTIKMKLEQICSECIANQNSQVRKKPNDRKIYKSYKMLSQSSSENCKFRTSVCQRCNKLGHLTFVCLSHQK